MKKILPVRIELATCGLLDHRSDQLSYRSSDYYSIVVGVVCTELESAGIIKHVEHEGLN